MGNMSMFSKGRFMSLEGRWVEVAMKYKLGSFNYFEHVIKKNWDAPLESLAISTTNHQDLIS